MWLNEFGKLPVDAPASHFCFHIFFDDIQSAFDVFGDRNGKTIARYATGQ